MRQHLSILFFLLLINITALTQTYNEGFKNGYKAGYCYNEYGCVAPPAVPTVPKPGKNSYQDGYNDGFAKGQSDKVDKQSNIRSNNSSQATPKSDVYVDYNEAINNGYNQAQQNVKTQLEIEQKRAELEKEQIELLRIREEQEQVYESKVNKQPELDFESGKIEKFKIKIPNKYGIQVFNPSRWYQMALVEEGKSVIGKRIYEDGTVLLFGISGAPSKSGSGLENINAKYDTLSLYPKVKLGINGEIVSNGYLINTVEFGESAFLAGIKVGDIITKIENEIITSQNSISASYKNKAVGDTLNIEMLRNGDKYYTQAILKNREGSFYGRLNVSGYPAIFTTWIAEEEDYGVKKKIMYVKNFVAVNNDLVIITYIIKPDSEYANFDNEFLRFKKTFKTHLSQIKIE